MLTIVEIALTRLASIAPKQHHLAVDLTEIVARPAKKSRALICLPVPATIERE
jgi:phenylpyruvate tautomerase PptA (4-oxalocrotonate tautomerase family)